MAKLVQAIVDGAEVARRYPKPDAVQNKLALDRGGAIGPGTVREAA